MVQISRLSVDLFANTAKFSEGMRKAGFSLKNFKKAAGLAAAAGTVLGTGLTALAIRQSSVIDETAKLSAALGVNVREFQALALVADESGISQDSLGNAITRSQRAIVEASRGAQTYARAFDTLGLKTNELLELSPDEQFNKIAAALAEIENPTVRTATALDIFGRSGRQVINTLNNYTEKVEEARQFNDKFNISLTAVDAAKVEEARDTFARIGKALGGLGNTLAVKFAPLVTAVSNGLLEAGISGETFGQAVSSAFTVAGKVIDVVRQSIIGLKILFGEVSLFINEIVLSATSGLLSVARAAAELPLIGDQFEGIEDGLVQISDGTKQAIDETRESIEGLVDQAVEFETIADKLKRIQDEAQKRAEISVSSGVFAPILDDGDQASDKLETVKNDTEKAKTAMEEFQDSSKRAFETLVDDATRGELSLRSIGNVALDVLSNVFSTAINNGTGSLGGLTGIIGNIGSSIGSIFGGASFATGIANVPRDMNARIHRGEMIIPAQQAKNIRSGSGAGASDTYYIDARGADQSGMARLEALIMQLNGSIEKRAVSAVSNEFSRNPRFAQ